MLPASMSALQLYNLRVVIQLYIHTHSSGLFKSQLHTLQNSLVSLHKTVIPSVFYFSCSFMFFSLCLCMSLPINSWDLVTLILRIRGFNELFQSRVVLRQKMDSTYCRRKKNITLSMWARRQPQHTVTDLPDLLAVRLKGTLEKVQP